MKTKTKQYFIDLGLKETEAEIYLCCLQHPMGVFVHEIVKATSIKRSTIDLILDRLRKDGFISRHKDGKRWVYIAEHPEKLAFTYQEKLNDFKGALPSILSEIQNEAIPHIRHYNELSGLEAIYNDILQTSERIPPPDNALHVISSGKDLIKLIPGHEKNFIQKRIRRGISTKVLAPKDMISERLYREHQNLLRETRFFDDAQYPFRSEINIYSSKVAFINFNENQIMGTVIQSSDIALSCRSLFQMIWNNTEKPEQ